MLLKKPIRALGKMLRYAKAIAEIIHKGFCRVFSSFSANVLPRQTEKFWNHPSISLLPTYLAPEFRRLGKHRDFNKQLDIFLMNSYTKSYLCIHFAKLDQLVRYPIMTTELFITRQVASQIGSQLASQLGIINLGSIQLLIKHNSCQ